VSGVLFCIETKFRLKFLPKKNPKAKEVEAMGQMVLGGYEEVFLVSELSATTTL